MGEQKAPSVGNPQRAQAHARLTNEQHLVAPKGIHEGLEGVHSAAQRDLVVVARDHDHGHGPLLQRAQHPVEQLDVERSTDVPEVSEENDACLSGRCGLVHAGQHLLASLDGGPAHMQVAEDHPATDRLVPRGGLDVLQNVGRRRGRGRRGVGRGKLRERRLEIRQDRSLAR